MCMHINNEFPDFPLVEVSSTGFGVQVSIDGKPVYAPQSVTVELGNEEFSMVTIKFPARVNDRRKENE